MVPFQSLSFPSYPIVLRVCWVPDLILAILLLSKPSGAPQNLHQPWHAAPVVVVKFTQLNLGMLYTCKITCYWACIPFIASTATNCAPDIINGCAPFTIQHFLYLIEFWSGSVLATRFRTYSGIFTGVLSVTCSNQLSSVPRETIWKDSLSSNNAKLLLRCMFSGFLQAKFNTDWRSHHALTILPANYDPVLLMQQQLAHSS